MGAEAAWFDWLLCGSLVVLGGWLLVARDLYQAVVLYIGFGLLLSLAWARLSAPDLALAEAVIGAGLTGAFLLHTVGALAEPRRPPPTGERDGE